MTPIRGSKVAITLSAMLGALMAVLDIAIINVGLSQIRTSLGAALDQVSWVSTCYMMANVVVIPMTGWLQRRLGFRRYYVGSLLLFTFASALCGSAFSLVSLCLFRVLQGLGGGAIIPTSQTLLLLRYPPKQHGLAGAFFGLGAITGPLVGPSLGGYLIDVLSWHWMFFINVPFGLLAAALAYFSIEEPGYDQGRNEPIDTVGLVLLVLSLSSMQFLLEEGNREDWWESRRIVAAAMVSGVTLCTFVVHELEVMHPIVNLRLFLTGGYTYASAINFLVGIAAFAGGYVFALYVGVIMGYSARDIGHIFLYGGSIQLILMPLSGLLGNRFDGRYLVGAGILITAFGIYLQTRLLPQSAFMDLVHPRLWISVGLSFVYVPLTLVGLSVLPVAERGQATGLFNLTRELGGSIGTALVSLILTRRLALHGAHLRQGVGLYHDITVREMGLSRRLGLASDQALDVLRLRIDQQALTLSFHDVFLIMSGVFALGVLLVLVLPRPARG